MDAKKALCMLVKEILQSATKPVFSFEFFPPKKTADWDKLFHTISELIPFNPSYVSVTYGAGGSTRNRTHDLVTKIQRETGLSVVSHLTCICSGKEEIRQILDEYSKHGIKNVLALRGDLPPGSASYEEATKDFPHAVDLVRFIAENFPDIGIGVAGFPEGHPQTPNRLQEIEYLKVKVDQGADYIVTQLFFDNRDFFDFVGRCTLAGINVPIIPGIMPVTTKKGLIRMSELALGARIPAPLLKRVLEASDDDEVVKIGIEWATMQVNDLIGNHIKGVHFYTLNNAEATRRIFQNIAENTKT